MRIETQGNRQTTGSVPISREFHPSDGLPEPPSLPVTVLSRSDYDGTGVSLSSLQVMAKLGAAQHFESVLSLIPFGSRGVPLHTLMLITIVKRTYLTK